ncbi:MAG: GH3 auxin-responsive promoter family protein, partial [Bacteroidota bacterium]
LANFDLPADLFEKDILMLSSSADLTPNKHHLEGEISGINSSNIPGWFDGFYKPGKAIASIDNWEERVGAIAAAAPDWDVAALAGIPSWIRMMLLKIIEVHQLDTIHDLWPNLRLYNTGGVAFEPHRKSFEKLVREPLTILDTYLASEGFFGFTARPGTMDMRLAIEHGIFYEFIPFDERGFDETGEILDDPLVLHLGQVEEGQDYALVVSTPAGAWRYLIGDTVKFTDLSQYEFVISGRTKYFLNVVGSQLSEEKLNKAVHTLAEETGIDINEYAVAALKNDAGEYEHHWVLGVNGDIPEEKAATRLDELLQEANKNYRVARQKALKGVNARVVPVDRIYAWLEQKKKKGGQIKVPKVMKGKMMRRLLEFL